MLNRRRLLVPTKIHPIYCSIDEALFQPFRENALAMVGENAIILSIGGKPMPITMNSGNHVLTLIITAAMALMVIFIRLRASRKPVNVMKIIMPPLGMSTGFLMFLYPPMRIPFTWAFLAFAAGVVFFSYPLMLTTKFHVAENQVYVQRSRAFIFILLGLLVIRVALHSYVEEFISVYQTGAIFFILAYGMILPWRVFMYVQFRKLQKTI
jgi:membrane protein CcdC involved in cytochrome C biogenesis